MNQKAKLEMVYFSALINQIITVWVDALQSTPTYIEFLLLLTKIMYIIHRLHTLYLHSKQACNSKSSKSHSSTNSKSILPSYRTSRSPYFLYISNKVTQSCMYDPTYFVWPLLKHDIRIYAERKVQQQSSLSQLVAWSFFPNILEHT